LLDAFLPIQHQRFVVSTTEFLSCFACGPFFEDTHLRHQPRVLLAFGGVDLPVVLVQRALHKDGIIDGKKV